MKHASGATKNSQNTRDDREPYADRHERIAASLSYRHAKQRGFLTGEDLLKSLEDEVEFNDSFKADSYIGDTRQEAP